MYQTVFSDSLFPEEKGVFDWRQFQSVISSEPSFIDWLKSSFSRSFEQLNTIEWAMSKRAWSTNMHERIFNNLQDSIRAYGDLSENVTFGISSAGNERNHFLYKGYAFILRKEDATTNDTKQGERIKNQEVSSHVITMEYAISPLRDSIISLKLAYYVGNNATYSMNISLSPAVHVSESSDEVTEIIPTKPKLLKKDFGTAVG